MLEIGLNGGHSALLALAHGVELHSVDICMHSYTRPVANYLQHAFKDRFYFYEGDSRLVLPQLREQNVRFGLFHIDGDHRTDTCRTDTGNARKLALRNAWILLDDTDMKDIRAFYQEQIQTETIIPARPGGWVETPRHEIGKLRISI